MSDALLLEQERHAWHQERTRLLRRAERAEHEITRLRALLTAVASPVQEIARLQALLTAAGITAPAQPRPLLGAASSSWSVLREAVIEREEEKGATISNDRFFTVRTMLAEAAAKRDPRERRMTPMQQAKRWYGGAWARMSLEEKQAAVVDAASRRTATTAEKTDFWVPANFTGQFDTPDEAA